MDGSVDSYLTVDAISFGEFKDRGSKFVAYLFSMNKMEDFEEQMAILKKEHLKARHHCFAYRMDFENEVFRFNDDGEPSGTAGKPIYGQLVKNNLFNVACISIRYFGGTKLGTSGLINAYKESTIAAINEATIITHLICSKVKLGFTYQIMGELMNVIKQMNLKIESKTLEESASIILEIPRSQVSEKMELLKAKLLKVSLDQVDEETTVPGLKIHIN